MRNASIWLELLFGTVHFGDIYVSGRIILKWIWDK
jgi:hypothetical protein